MIKFCKRCQCDTERQSSGNCKPCAKLASDAYKAANKSKLSVSRAAYEAAHREEKKASTAAWRAANPVRVAEYALAYRIANPEKVKAAIAAYVAKNPEKVKATQAATRKAHPETNRLKLHNRNKRKRSSGGRLSKGLISKLLKLQHGKCPCCSKPLGVNYHLDHIIPIHLGGANTDDNIQLLRAKCNREKSAKHPVDFMQSRGFLI